MTNTREITIDKLTEGDVVVAMNGKPRPFPYEVTQVVTNDITHRGKRYYTTQVKFAHGGFIPPCDPSTAVATVLV